MRQEAVHALGKLGVQEAGAKILELIDDPVVCQSDLYVLSQLNVKDAIP